MKLEDSLINNEKGCLSIRVGEKIIIEPLFLTIHSVECSKYFKG